MNTKAPRKCAACRVRAVVPTVLSDYDCKACHDGRDYALHVRDLPVSRCQNCGAISLGEEANERITAALREAVGLMSGDEMRAQREALGLTQKELAAFLTVSETSLSRWETGSQLPQRAMNLLLRLFFECPEVRRKVGMTKPIKERITAAT